MSVYELLTDHTVRVVVVGSTLIGVSSGALGCFAYLRRQSLMGDVVSHSSLLGIVLAFWISHLLTGEGNRSLWVLMPGAFAAGVLSLLLTRAVHRTTRLKEDASLGVMLAIFFGTAMMLLRYIQRASPPITGRAGLDQYLFGMAAAMTIADIWMIGVLAGVALSVMLLTWSRLKIITFDQSYAAGLGLPVSWIEILLLMLLVTGVVIGLQIAGVILMVALLVGPPAIARQWSGGLGSMVSIACVVGGVSCGLGGLVSAVGTSLSTGPVIVLILTTLFVVSVFVAPGRGLLHRRLRMNQDSRGEAHVD